MTDRPILIAEPQCAGFEHAPVNAAWVATARLAFPGAPLVFLGEREHLRWVRETLKPFPELANGGVEWVEWRIPPRGWRGWGRLPGEWRWGRELLGQMTERGARLALVCSIADAGLLTLKLLLGRGGLPSPVWVVFHRDLGGILQRWTRRVWDWPLQFRQVLRLPHPRGLGYIVLGPSLLPWVKRALPSQAGHFRALEHPYLWIEREAPAEIAAPETVRFGFVGVASKGFKSFCRLAREARSQAPRAEFSLVGFLNQPIPARMFAGVVADVSGAPLSAEEFDRRLSRLTYAVWTARPEKYRLSASATFIDALARGKPCICLRNPYIEHYFKEMGDIGHLCDSLEEMRDLVARLAREFPLERYRGQCRNIAAGRGIFTPQTLAPQLREIVEQPLTVRRDTQE